MRIFFICCVVLVTAVASYAYTKNPVGCRTLARDFAALCQLLKLDLPYVGLLGPRKRRDQLLNAVLDEGIAIAAQVFAPAGLDLGAETPEELALALVSEIQAVFADASAESLRDRKAPIHGWNVIRRSVKECATSAP